MTFIKIHPKRSGSSGSLVSGKITMGAYLAEGVGKPRQIAFRIPFAVIQESGIPVDENRKVMLGLHEGVGEDVGFLQIYHEPEKRLGISISQSRKRGEPIEESGQGFSAPFRFERFQYYTPNEWPISATEVDHIIDNGTIIVQVPDWFKPNLAKMEEEGLLPQPKDPPKIEEPRRPLHLVKDDRKRRRG